MAEFNLDARLKRLKDFAAAQDKGVFNAEAVHLLRDFVEVVKPERVDMRLPNKLLPNQGRKLDIDEQRLGYDLAIDEFEANVRKVGL